MSSLTATRLLVIACSAMAAFCGLFVANAQEPVTNKRKLGPEINSEAYRDAAPLISADGKTLYFLREDQGQELAKQMNAQATSALDDLEKELAKLDPAMRKQMEESLRGMRRTSQQSPVSLNLVHQTIWVSQRQANGGWSPAVKMPPPLSDDVASLWVGSVLPDNNTLLVGGAIDGGLLQRARDMESRIGRDAGHNGFLDLLLKRDLNGIASLDGIASDRSRVFAWATRTANGWGAPTPLRMRDFRHNADRLEIVLAPDGRHVLLAIRNAESLGEHDLYVSTLGDDGVWSKPANLGATVNSPGRECSPFVAPDGKTLYFCSNRPGGLGGYDFYVTRRLDDSWLKWSAPQNMGPDINTKHDDISLTVDATGRFAFMSLGPLLHEDIYEFELPPALRPHPVAFVFGKVTNPEGKPLPAGIAYELLRSGQEAGQATAKPGDGRYQIALAIGEDYAFRAAASGYVAISDRIDLTKARTDERFERNLILVPLEVGKPIRLNNVFFDSAKTALLPESRRELDRLVSLLSEMPSLRIEVRGHTDSLDDDAFNVKLSEGRAAAVTEYLRNAGIASGRLQSKGVGEQVPIGSNATDEGRQQNRRVEFVILSR